MKPFWKSRSLWLHGVVCIAPWIPFVNTWIHRDPIHVMQYHALLAFALRFDTKQPLGKTEQGEKP